MLVFSILGVWMSIPGQTMGVGPFKETLQQVLGLTQDQLAIAYLVGTTCSGLILVAAGKFYDGFGTRLTMVATAALFGGVLMTMSRVDRISDWAISAAPAAWAGWVAPFVVISVGFFTMRFLGQGVLTMVSRNLPMKWFVHHRGFANGVAGVFISVGFSLSPRILKWSISAYSWRTTWFVAGLFTATVFAILAWIFVRDNPEDHGLKPDGGDEDPSEEIHQQAEHQYTLTEAMKTPALWVFAVGLSVFSLYITALTFHLETIYDVAGRDPATAFNIFFPATCIAVVIHFSGSWISDYIHLKYILVAHLLALGVSAYGLLVLGPGPVVWVVIIGNGVASGTWGVLGAVTWPRFFGRKHLGTVSSFFMTLLVFASALGPVVFSKSLKWTGSFGGATRVCLVIVGVLLVAAMFGNNPNEQVHPDDASP